MLAWQTHSTSTRRSSRRTGTSRAATSSSSTCSTTRSRRACSNTWTPSPSARPPSVGLPSARPGWRPRTRRSTSLPEWTRSPRSPTGSPPTAHRHAPRSRPPPNWTTLTPPTSSPRSRERSTSTSGSWRLTSRRKSRLAEQVAEPDSPSDQPVERRRLDQLPEQRRRETGDIPSPLGPVNGFQQARAHGDLDHVLVPAALHSGLRCEREDELLPRRVQAARSSVQAVEDDPLDGRVETAGAAGARVARIGQLRPGLLRGSLPELDGHQCEDGRE